MTATSPPLARHPMTVVRESAPSRERTPLDWIVVLAGLAVAAGWVVQLPLVMAAGAACLVLLLAAVRFDHFVLFLLVARSALDATKGAGALSATTLLGALFLGAVLIREVLIRSTGSAVPLLRSPVRTPLMALLAISVLSGALADAPTSALMESLRLAGVVAMVIALERMLATSDAAASVLVAVFLSSILPMALGLYQLAFGHGRTIGGFSRVQGTFTHPNPFSIYLAVLLVLAAALVRHVKGWARAGLVTVLVLGSGLLVATLTRGSWIALLVGLVIVGGLQSRRLIGAVVVVGIGVAVAVPQVRARFTDLLGGDNTTAGAGNSLTWRIQHWQDALSLGRESPLIGIGLKGIERLTSDGANAHNDLVRIGVETGAAGLLIYFGLAASLFWTARRALQTAPPGWRRGAAVGYAGMLGVLAVASLSSNIITQVVLLWYVAAISIAVVAVSPSVAAGQGRRKVSADGTLQPLPERVGPARKTEPEPVPVPPAQQRGVGATPPSGALLGSPLPGPSFAGPPVVPGPPRPSTPVPAKPVPAKAAAAPVKPKRPRGVPRRAKNPDQGRSNSSAKNRRTAGEDTPWR